MKEVGKDVTWQELHKSIQKGIIVQQDVEIIDAALVLEVLYIILL